MTWDFDGIKTEIKDRLSLLSNWATTLYYGAYERIIDVIAYIANKIVLIAAFYYRESLWSAAQIVTSLTQDCDRLNYTFHRRIGAIGGVEISSDPNFSLTYNNLLNDISISKWHRFSNTAGTINVFSTENVIYHKNTFGYQEIPVKEGIPREYEYIANGVASEQIFLYSTDSTYGIDNDEVDVYIVDDIGNILYTVNIVDSLYAINDLVNYYCTVKTAFDFGSVIVTFGDGVTTLKLTARQRVLIKYADTLGSNGNIQSSNSISKITDSLYDVNGTDVTASLFVTNLEAISDGADTEDIESIRENAPLLFQTGYRAGSIYDWTAIINSIPSIYDSAIWTINDLGGSSLLAEQNTVYVTGVTTTGDDLTDDQKEDIEQNYLRERISITETVTWQPLEKVYGFFDITAKISNKTSEIVRNQIVNEIESNYSTLHTTFQSNIYESNASRKIDSLENINHLVSFTLDNMEKNLEKSVNDGTIIPSYLPSDTDDKEKQVLLVQNSFRLWTKLKVNGSWGGLMQVGQEVSGVIYNTLPSSFSITQGYTYPTTNKYSFSISTASGSGVLETGVPNPGDSTNDGYLVYISYQTKDGNGNNLNSVRLPQRYQITDIDDDFIWTDLSYV